MNSGLQNTQRAALRNVQSQITDAKASANTRAPTSMGIGSTKADALEVEIAQLRSAVLSLSAGLSNTIRVLNAVIDDL